MEIYNSNNPFYRSPLGAVPLGCPVAFYIAVPPAQPAPAPRLCISTGAALHEEIPMRPAGTNSSGTLVFTCEFAPKETGVYFYYFDLYTGYRKIYRGPLGSGVESTAAGQEYQLTVYEGSFTLPKSTAGGVFYQIFPDRFYEPTPHTSPLPFERIYQKNKTAVPFFGPAGGAAPIGQDYYGGNFAGIAAKLPYLAGLGVTHIYLNPIFEAHENHRYSTANYLNADPLLGTNEEFSALCATAKTHGIKIILDGVFSHTGADSIYFNKFGRYTTLGAYQSENSPYRGWYFFSEEYAAGYRSWWGFENLPEVNEENPEYRDFTAKVLHHWLSLGAAGFRLDVADELPDDFIAFIRKIVKEHDDENLLIGEVWEDATNKISYGRRRTYLLGKGLDSVMNYPFRSAVLAFLQNGKGQLLAEAVVQILENYPKPAVDGLWNFLSTHDTARLATALLAEGANGRGRLWQSEQTLSREQKAAGVHLVKLGLCLQFTLPGCPVLYYGDEVMMHGYTDPFNRAYYPWESEDYGLREEIAALATLRKAHPALQTGNFTAVTAKEDLFAFVRSTVPTCSVAGAKSGSVAAGASTGGKHHPLNTKNGACGETVLVAINRAWHENTVVYNGTEYCIPKSSWRIFPL